MIYVLQLLNQREEYLLFFNWFATSSLIISVHISIAAGKISSSPMIYGFKHFEILEETKDDAFKADYKTDENFFY